MERWGEKVEEVEGVDGVKEVEEEDFGLGGEVEGEEVKE